MPAAIALALLVFAVAMGPLGGTQAARIGEGIEIRVADGPNGQYAELDGEQVTIDLDAGNPPEGGGTGLNRDAISRFNRVFLIINTNTENRESFVHVTDAGALADALDVFATTGGTRTSIEGSDDAIRIGPGETIPVGIAIDTTGSIGSASSATLSIKAVVSELVEAVLAVETVAPTVGEPVTFQAGESTGDSLEYTYEFDDGVIRDEAGPEIRRTFAEVGTYNVTLTVEETTTRGASGTDTATASVVVTGDGRVEALGSDAETTLDLPDAEPSSDSDASVVQVRVETTVSTTGEARAAAVAAESVDDLTGDTDPNGDPVAGVNITVPSDAENAPATVTLTVADRTVPAGVSPDELVVERYNDTTGSWEALPTTVGDTTGGTVTLVAETPGFSLFAVTVPAAPETPTPTTPTPETPTPTTPTPETPTPTTPTPERPGKVGEADQRPTDPNGDGVFEDVNGDGDLKASDATVLFNAVLEGDPAVVNNPESFDLTGDGEVTPGDASVLFNEVFEAPFSSDPDNDGVFEDVNGDGEVTPGDASVLFNAVLDDDLWVTTEPERYDVTGDGEVTPGDANVLFNNAFEAAFSDSRNSDRTDGSASDPDVGPHDATPQHDARNRQHPRSDGQRRAMRRYRWRRAPRRRTVRWIRPKD